MVVPKPCLDAHRLLPYIRSGREVSLLNALTLAAKLLLALQQA